MEELKSAINWFEIPATDFNRAVRFDGAKLYLNGGSDLLTVLNRVEDAGGMIVTGKTQTSPEIGYFAIIDDAEDNRVYLHSMN